MYGVGVCWRAAARGAASRWPAIALRLLLLLQQHRLDTPLPSPQTHTHTHTHTTTRPQKQVYSKAGEAFDPAKKPDRYKPEFIWNTNWQEQLKLQEDLERQRREYLEAQRAAKEGRGAAAGGGGGAGAPAGVVSLSRLSALDDVNVDLTEQLLAAKRRDEERRKAREERERRARAEAAAAGGSGEQQQSQQQQRQPQQPRPGSAVNASAGASPSFRYKDLPSRGEARRFARATRISSTGVALDSVGTLAPEEAARRAAEAEEGRKRYEQLKVEFQLWTLGGGLLGAATTYLLYSQVRGGRFLLCLCGVVCVVRCVCS